MYGHIYKNKELSTSELPGGIPYESGHYWVKLKDEYGGKCVYLDADDMDAGCRKIYFRGGYTVREGDSLLKGSRWVLIKDPFI